jgi:hypothetical protein
MCRLSWNLGALTSWNPRGLSRSVMGLLYHMCVCVCVCVRARACVCPADCNVCIFLLTISCVNFWSLFKMFGWGSFPAFWLLSGRNLKMKCYVVEFTPRVCIDLSDTLCIFRYVCYLQVPDVSNVTCPAPYVSQLCFVLRIFFKDLLTTNLLRILLLSDNNVAFTSN